MAVFIGLYDSIESMNTAERRGIMLSRCLKGIPRSEHVMHCSVILTKIEKGKA